MDAQIETPPPPPSAPDNPKLFELTDEQRAAFAEHLANGWQLKDRRRMPVRMKLGPTQIAQLGKEAARIDEDLKSKRQGKNARQALLLRERNERQGAISSLSSRLRCGHDEIDREMSVDTEADYSRRIAHLRADYDAFEASRKAEIKTLKEELEELEAQQQAIAGKIRDGNGNVVTDVVDLIDYQAGVVMILRLDTGGLVAKRALTEHERQLELFTIKDEFPPLDEHEYTLAVSERLNDAARAYAERVGIDYAAAKSAVRRMLPDEELPPEDPPRNAAPGDQAQPESKDAADGDEDTLEEDEELEQAAEPAADVGEGPWDVMVVEVRDGRKVHVLKALQDIMQVPLKRAKEVLGTLPAQVMRANRYDEAESAMDVLEQAGAKVAINEVGDDEYVSTEAEDELDEAQRGGVHPADDPTEAIGYGKRGAKR